MDSQIANKNKKTPKPSLDTAICTVHLDFRRNHALIDRAVLDAKLTKETTASLRSYGVNVTAGPTETQLGGGPDDILSAIKFLLDIKDYFGVLLALVSVPFKIYQSHSRSKAMAQAPAANVYLTIGHDGEIHSETFYDDLSARVSTLAQAAYTETKRLQAKYPMYSFGSVVIVNLPAYCFSAHFSLTAQSNSLFNHRRMLKVINNLKFQEGLALFVYINSAGLVVHDVAPQVLIIDSPHSEKDWRHIGRSKKFYTLVSGRIIGGYRRVIPTMPYKRYYDKYLRPSASGS